MFPWKLQRVSASEGYAGHSPSESTSSTGSLTPSVSREITCPVLKATYETSGALTPHLLPCGHTISSQALYSILKEPLPSERQCPHSGCTAVLESCSVADYPADRDAQALVSHHSFSFSSGAPVAHAHQASITSVASTASGGSDALDVANNWAALQRIDSGGQRQASHHDIDSPSKPEERTVGAQCRPILTSVPSALMARHCSSTLSERTVSGSPLQHDHRPLRGATSTPVRRRPAHSPGPQPSGASTHPCASSQPHRKPLPSYNSVPATTQPSRSPIQGGRSIRRAISLQTDPPSRPTARRNGSGEAPASLLFSQASAVLITVVDCNKQKLKLLLHGQELTVADVKQQIFEQMGNPVRDQRLLYKGMLLVNTQMLTAYGIGQKAQLRLHEASFRATF